MGEESVMETVEKYFTVTKKYKMCKLDPDRTSYPLNHCDACAFSDWGAVCSNVTFDDGTSPNSLCRVYNYFEEVE